LLTGGGGESARAGLARRGARPTRLALLTLLGATAAGLPAPTAAESRYVVRNDTSRAFTCGLRREGRSVLDRFVIRSGERWEQVSERDGRRSLLCDSQTLTPQWRVYPGLLYRLVEDSRTGRVVLREGPPSAGARD